MNSKPSTGSPVRSGSRGRLPEPATPAAQPAARKSLINKDYSRFSRFSRLIDNPDANSGLPCLLTHIKGWSRLLLNLLNLLELFFLNGLRAAGWLLRTLTTRCKYHHRIAAPSHSSSSTSSSARTCLSSHMLESYTSNLSARACSVFRWLSGVIPGTAAKQLEPVVTCEVTSSPQNRHTHHCRSLVLLWCYVKE